MPAPSSTWTFRFLQYLETTDAGVDGVPAVQVRGGLALRVPLSRDQAERLHREQGGATFQASLGFVHPGLQGREALFAEEWPGRLVQDGEGRAWLAFEAREVSGAFLLELMSLGHARSLRRSRLVVSARIHAVRGGGERGVCHVAADWDLRKLLDFCKALREGGAEILVEDELPWRPAACA